MAAPCAAILFFSRGARSPRPKWPLRAVHHPATMRPVHASLPPRRAPDQLFDQRLGSQPLASCPLPTAEPFDRAQRNIALVIEGRAIYALSRLPLANS
jgi:hypothetical protein